MADPIIGTPAIVGFGNGFDRNGLDVGLAALLLQQNLSRDHADISRDVATASGANMLASATNAHNVEESVESNAMHTNELILAQAAQTNGLITTNLLEMTRLSAAQILLATQNQAAALAQAAECCCETKALIIEKANATDALMRDLRAQDLAIELADVKAELIAARALAAAAAAP